MPHSDKLFFCRLVFMGGLLLITSVKALASDNPEYPLRAKYPYLSMIETDELLAIYDQAIIVDARNKAEYDVVHIAGAQSMPVETMKEEQLLAVRGKNSDTPIVFYCNGIVCFKSYEAGKKAHEWGFSNVRVYDDGIFRWAQSHPERTEFFGRPLTAETVKTAFISREKLDQVSLPTVDFIARAKSGDFTIIDIRDPNERSGAPVRLPKVKVLPLDIFVPLLGDGGRAVPQDHLLIMDNAGSQIEWVQYYLEKAGVTDYFFLKGGVRQWKEDGYGEAGNKNG